MGQVYKVGKTSTKVKKSGTPGEKGFFLSVTYHATEVVRVENGTVTLDTGGWFTATTKTRMNQASNEYGLGFGAYQRKGSWHVCLRGSDKRIPWGGTVMKFPLPSVNLKG